MISFAILVGLVVLLFVAAFLSKRRFGILGLALAAGATVSSIWTYDAGLVVAGFGLIPQGALADAIVPSVIILLPAIILFFTGYKYKNILSRGLGSLLFAVLAMAFLVVPIGSALPVDGLGATVYNWLLANRELVISAGIVIAVADLFLRKSAPPVEKSRKKK